MANDLNRCEFIGRLGRDVETRYTPDGTAVANFSIAVGWKTKEKEGAEWVRIVAFGKLGEICSEYLSKGKQVYIAGRFRTREYEKDGEKRYATEIVADQMQMLGGREGGDQQEQPQQQRSRPQSNDGGADAYRDAQQGTRRPPERQGQSLSEDFDDQIPF